MFSGENLDEAIVSDLGSGTWRGLQRLQVSLENQENANIASFTEAFEPQIDQLIAAEDNYQAVEEKRRNIREICDKLKRAAALAAAKIADMPPAPEEKSSPSPLEFQKLLAAQASENLFKKEEGSNQYLEALREGLEDRGYFFESGGKKFFEAYAAKINSANKIRAQLKNPQKVAPFAYMQNIQKKVIELGETDRFLIFKASLNDFNRAFYADFSPKMLDFALEKMWKSAYELLAKRAEKGKPLPTSEELLSFFDKKDSENATDDLEKLISGFSGLLPPGFEEVKKVYRKKLAKLIDKALR